MSFVHKQSITLDNNNAVLTDLWPFFSFNTVPHTSVGRTSCISIVFFGFENLDSFHQYAACWITLKPVQNAVLKYEGPPVHYWTSY